MVPDPTFDAEALLRHGAWLAQLARALVARDDEIDDVLQQTWAQALATPPRHDTNLRSWLGAIARNVIRASKRSDVARAAREVHAPRPPIPETPDELVARAELRRAVVDAVLALAEPYRSAVMLRFFEERDVAAIAEHTKAPEATVRTRIRRGVGQVREALQTAFGCDEEGGEVRASAARALLFARLEHLARDGVKGAVAGGSAVVVGRVVTSFWSKWMVAAAIVAAAAFVTRRVSQPDATTSRGSDAQTTQPGSAVATTAEPGREGASRAPESITAARDPETPKHDAGSSTAEAATTEGGTVRGVVRDESGRLVSRAMVYMCPAPWDVPRLSDVAAYVERLRDSRSEQIVPGDPATRLSGVDGSFEFTGVSVFRDWVVAAYDAERGAATSGHLHFDASHVSFELQLELLSPVVARGNVTDADGHPIGNARVDVTYADPPSPNGKNDLRTTTGATGSWSCTSIFTRHLDVSASAIGYARTEHPRPVDILIGQHEAIVDLVLEPAVVDPKIVAVSGPIVDNAGRAVDLQPRIDLLLGPEWAGDESRGRLQVYAIEPSETAPKLGRRLADASAMGSASIQASRYDIGLPAEFRGTLVLTFGRDRRVVGTAPIDDLARPPALPIDLASFGPPIQTATLVVSLVEAATAEQVDAIGVRLVVNPALPEAHGIPPSPISRPNQAVNVREFTVPVGRVTAVAYRPGFIAANAEVVLTRAGERSEVTMAFRRAIASVRGHALQADGSPDVHARVRVYRAGDRGWELVPVATANPTAEGLFEITGLAAEDYLIAVDSTRAMACFARVRAATPPPEIEFRGRMGERVQLVARGLDEESEEEGETMWRVLDSGGTPVYDGLSGVCQCSIDLNVCLVPGHYRAFVWSRGSRETVAEFDAPAIGPIDVPVKRPR